MVSLPISIEDHLAQAGFCGTEILVLRHVLSGEQYTIRELASKTGKSTGVLDQSIKKLLRKKILVREIVNTTPKYTIGSLATLSIYLQSYFTNHVSQTQRRANDMTNFLHSLEVENSQPKVEYFIGKVGIEKIFKRIAKCASGADTIASYMPISPEMLEDFADAHAEFTRFRRAHNITLQVLTHESQLTKRYQSEDCYNNRQTRFIRPDQCLLYIEHVITDSAYFCIDYKRLTGYMILYPEFSAEKRSIFNALWSDASLTQPTVQRHEVVVPLTMEDFFFTRQSIQLNSVLVIVALLCVFMLQIVHPASVRVTGPLSPVFNFMGIIFLLLLLRMCIWWRPLCQKAFVQSSLKYSLVSCTIVSLISLLV